MKTEIHVSPKYSFLNDFIREIPQSFQDLGDEIYEGRNIVRLIPYNDLILVVKYFKSLTLANRYIYATIRKSKAQRAFEHTQKMDGLGFNSPEAVAYIDCYKNGKLSKNFYISLFTDYKPISQLMDVPIAESTSVIKAFARYTYRLHKAGIFHADFTISNILYRMKDDEYDFTLIDNNRMNFGKYSNRRALKNLNRLNITTEMMGVFAAEYARQANTSEHSILDGMVIYRWCFLIHRTLRRRIKMRMLSLIGKKKKS